MAKWEERLHGSEHAALAVLYVLDAVGVPISLEDIQRITASYTEAGFFEVSEALSILCDSGLVTMQGWDFTLSEEGKASIEMFRTKIPASQRERVDEFVRSNAELIRLSARNRSRVMRAEKGWEVILTTGCEARLELRMTLPTRALADEMCSRWTYRGEELLNEFLDGLK